MARAAAVCRTAFGRIDRFDRVLVLAVAGLITGRASLAALRAVSRLGDWGLSVATGLLLILDEGALVGLRFAVVAGLGVALQCTLKLSAARVRPCRLAGGPPQRVAIPDEGSFPSGHTLHAVMAAVVITANLPVLGALFVPLAVLMGLSRVALGVHYPSDVAAGGALGAVCGLLVG